MIGGRPTSISICHNKCVLETLYHRILVHFYRVTCFNSIMSEINDVMTHWSIVNIDTRTISQEGENFRFSISLFYYVTNHYIFYLSSELSVVKSMGDNSILCHIGSLWRRYGASSKNLFDFHFRRCSVAKIKEEKFQQQVVKWRKKYLFKSPHNFRSNKK